MRIVAYHDLYGCETGCCGHYVKEADEPGYGKFQFEHPYGGDTLDLAKGLVRAEYGEEHVADLDWDNCIIVDD